LSWDLATSLDSKFREEQETQKRRKEVECRRNEECRMNSENILTLILH